MSQGCDPFCVATSLQQTRARSRQQPASRHPECTQKRTAFMVGRRRWPTAITLHIGTLSQKFVEQKMRGRKGSKESRVAKGAKLCHRVTRWLCHKGLTFGTLWHTARRT